MSKYIATYTPETEPPKRYIELTYKNRPLEMAEQGKWFEKAVEYKHFLEEADRARGGFVQCKSLADLPEEWRGITSLTLYGADEALIKSLPHILEKATDLRRFSILQPFMKWTDICALDLSNIESLLIHTDQIAYSPRLECPNAKELYLSCDGSEIENSVDEECENHMDYTGLQSLEQLSLSSEIKLCMDDFAGLKSLKYLKINKAQSDNLDWLQNAKYSLKTLIVISGLKDCQGLKYQKEIEDLSFEFHEITDVHPIEQLKNLKKLFLGRDLIQDEGNLRNMNLESIRITSRDAMINDILHKVTAMGNDAVRDSLYYKKQMEDNRDNQTTFRYRQYKAFVAKSFCDQIKHLVRAKYNQYETEFATQKWRDSMQNRVVKVMSPEEYVDFFRESAYEKYPFLAEERIGLK